MPYFYWFVNANASFFDTFIVVFVIFFRNIHTSSLNVWSFARFESDLFFLELKIVNESYKFIVVVRLQRRSSKITFDLNLALLIRIVVFFFVLGQMECMKKRMNEWMRRALMFIISAFFELTFCDADEYVRLRVERILMSSRKDHWAFFVNTFLGIS